MEVRGDELTRKGGNLRANEQNSSKRMRVLQLESLWAFSSPLQMQKATAKNSYTTTNSFQS